MRIVRSAISTLVILAFSSAFALGVASPVAAQQDRDCDEFATQQEAQQVFEQNPDDVFLLDGDDDGIACEHLAEAPEATESPVAPDEEARQETPTPVGGVATGGGGAAGQDVNAGIIGVGGAFLVFAGAGLLLVRRLRRTS